MAVSILTRFLTHYDPLMYGVNPNAPLGVDLMAGVGGWCVPGGLHVLYRGTPDYSDISFDAPVGAVSPTDAAPETVKTFATYPFAASTRYCIALRAVGLGGAIEQNTDLATRIETDGDGVPLGLVPNPPMMLNAQPRAGGTVLLTWQYNPRGQQTPPYTYSIYHNNGSGAVSYVTAIGESRGRSFLTPAYADATTVIFGVRAASADGVEETNLTTVSCLTDAAGPPDIDTLSVTRGVET